MKAARRLWTAVAITTIIAISAAPLVPGRHAFAQDIPAEPRFNGRTVEESSPPYWPPLERAPEGAPNILVILTDDVGYGASSTFGGPVPTPTLDALAEDGLRYTQFNNTAMCSPTRASLLTGRNHTRVGMGLVTDRATGYDGYTTIIPPEAGTVAEVLRQGGYNTSAYGKWHLTPLWEMGPNGPYDHWAVRMGFDHFYGFLTGDTDQWSPTLWNDLTPVEPPVDDPDFIHDKAITDDAIAWLRRTKGAAPDKPFFIYFNPGAAHAPHHAPAEWVARFDGQFDQGWDRQREVTLARQIALGVVPADTALTERPPEIPAWDSLTHQQQQVYADEMEAFAASLSFADYQVGRIIDELKATGQYDNTLIFYMQGDNGGSGEGGLNGAFNETAVLNAMPEDFAQIEENSDLFGSRYAHSNYPAGWGHATSAPFQFMKQIGSHFGGSRSGVVVSWPLAIRNGGGVRSQFHHVVDVAPTILEAAKLEFPDELNGVHQMSVDGMSIAYTFSDAAAPTRRTTQFFTMWDNLAIYHSGWVAATTPHVWPWDLLSTAGPQIDGRPWELYNIEEDFSQAHNLAAEQPERLRQLQELYWAEAARNGALPIHRNEGGDGKPSWTAAQTRFTFLPGTSRLPTASAPVTVNRSYTIEAELEVPETGAEGIIVTHGGRTGGFGFYTQANRLVFHYNLAGLERYNIVSTRPLSAGNHLVAVKIDYEGGRTGAGAAVTLLEDGRTIGTGRLERTLPRFYGLDAQFDVGLDTGSPVNESYAVPFASNSLRRVTVTLR